MKKTSSIFNSVRVRNQVKGLRVIKISDSITVNIKADASPDDPAEMMLYDEIGKDPWTGAGITAADFRAALNTVQGRSLSIRINSMGGDVFQGMAIKSMLDEWPQKVKVKIDGIAASTASFIPMGADEIEMAMGAQMFIHDAWGYCQGNAEDMTKTASQLDSTSDLIAGMYAQRNGKTVAKMRGMMKEESLMTAEQCKELGLCDTISAERAVRNFTPAEISSMKAKLNTLHESTNSVSDKTQAGKQTQIPPQNIMNRIQMLALLKKHGTTPPDNETDLQILARVEAIEVPAPKAQADPAKVEGPLTVDQINDLRSQNKEMKEFMNESKRMRVVARVDKFVGDDILPLAMRDEVVALAMENEKTLDVYAKLPPNRPGCENVKVSTIELTGSSFKDVQEHILRNGPALSGGLCVMNPRNMGRGGISRGSGVVNARDIFDGAMEVARTIAKHRNMLVSMFNTNTIDAELQRTVILSDFLRAFSAKLLPLSAFCKTFSNVPLEGTDKVAVPYFALQTAASTDWVAATGYVTGDTAESVRDVTVNKRKYQAMAFTSQELRRQPYQNWQQLAAMNAEKLGVDVNADVLSVITAANYGAPIKTVPGAAFSSDDIADLYGAATDLNWPDDGRSLVLTTAYKVGLLKDPTFKNYLSAGDTDALRKAQIKSAYGFEDIYTVPTANLPQNNEHLRGFICHLAACQVATAPIMPAPAVRALMVQYDLVVDPINNIAIEYKLMGDAFKDKTAEIVECNYGYNPGVQAALARITDA